MQQVKETLDQALFEKRQHQEFMRSLGPCIVEALRPTLDELSLNSKSLKEDLIKAFSSLEVNVPKVEIPPAKVEVNIPEIKVPTPIVNLPPLNMEPTNQLLISLIKKTRQEDKPLDISVELKIV